MKIVITIDDDIYDDYLKQGATVPKYSTAMNSLYEALWNGTPLKEWLKTFNTDSAPICFNKIQELKRECERDELTTKS